MTTTRRSGTKAATAATAATAAMSGEPVPLLFSCDTEDYETPASDDAELLWARMFARHGIRACFCVVGEEARALRARGRDDVLAALARHEIASHSNMHSAHPTPAEYLDELSFRDGVERFRQEEAPAVRDLNDLLGQQPSAWCKPGNSWGPAVPSAAAALGIPMFCDAPLEWAPGQPLWFAGGPLDRVQSGETEDAPVILQGGLLLKYHTSFDRYFGVPEGERQARMRADFEALLASRQEEAARTQTAPGTVVMYTHPCRTLTAAFPSNFTAGKNPPREAWQPAPLRPKAEADALVRDFDAFLEWIGELRAQGRVALTTYREIYARYREPAETRLQTHQVMELARALAVDNAPLAPRRTRDGWLSPAEQYGVLVRALSHASYWNELPKEFAVRRLLGPIDRVQAALAPQGPPKFKVQSDQGGGEGGGRGMDDARDGRGQSKQIPLRLAQQAAALADERCAAEDAVPARLGIPELGERDGPGRVLRLVARGLVVWSSGAHGDTVLAAPAGGDETAFAQRDDFKKLRFKETWSIFPPEFEGRRLLHQAWWQTWSAKPATVRTED